jgi:hypothetical protein
MLPKGVTPRTTVVNDPQMESCLQENIVPRQSFTDLDRWMERYQQANPQAPAALVGALSPALHRFFIFFEHVLDSTRFRPTADPRG